MNELTLRFYGRFVMVERGGAGQTADMRTFLMPNMTFDSSGLREHHAFMTIARHAIDARPNKTEIEPTFRVMTDGPVEEAENFMWNLAGWEVDLGLTGGSHLEIAHGRELVDLAELERLLHRSARLRTDRDLYPSTDGIVRTAIHVGGGRGVGRAGFPTHPCTFIKFNESHLPNPMDIRPSKVQIDIVDFTVPIPDNHVVTLKKGREEARRITVLGRPNPTIAFSNLCNELPHDITIDREFAQYYHVLDVVSPDRLVPKVVPHGGDQDCNRPSRIRVD